MKSASLLALVLFVATMSRADQILVLSGGRSPIGNHYSQYLQTKTMADQLRLMVPQTPTSVLFAAGNQTGQAPLLADVHRQMNTPEGNREVMSVGFIDGNQPATVANVDRFMAQPKLAQMKANETFFLFVSDHGMPFVNPDGSSDPTFSNNCMDLWGFEADLATGTFKTPKPGETCYSKERMRTQLENKVSAGRVVFAMSQCFSGGFHQMSVNLNGAYPTANPRICGFTAVTDDTTASGCTPDVDGPGYQGYERSFTEQLTGVDVVDGHRLRPARTSVVQAHREAALNDFAKDIPLATSDYYLSKWFLSINQAKFQPRTAVISGAQAQKQSQAVVIGKMSLQDPQFQSKQAFFSQMQNQFLKMYPEYQTQFLGDLSLHQKLEAQLKQTLDQTDRNIQLLYQQMEPLNSQLMQAWTQYVSSGKSALSPREAMIETKFFGALEQINGVGSADGQALYLMSIQAVTAPSSAEALSQYKARRSQYAQDWALASGNPKLVQVAQTLQKLEQDANAASEESGTLEKRHGHVRRLLIYREVLGAWAALSAMKDETALKEIKGLVTCEEASLK